MVTALGASDLLICWSSEVRPGVLLRPLNQRASDDRVEGLGSIVGGRVNAAAGWMPKLHHRSASS